MGAGKKIFSFIMSLVMLLSLLSFNDLFPQNNVWGKDTVESGKCGEEAVWEFDNSTGELTISGKGNMYDNPGFENMTIKKVVIEEGITGIGNDSFISQKLISEVKFPSTLESIGDWAFWGCEGITTVFIPASVSNIGEVAFEKCASLNYVYVDSNSKNYFAIEGILYTKDMKELILYPAAKKGDAFTVPDRVETIGLYAFDYNKYLKTINIPSGVKKVGENTPFTGAEALININIAPENTNYSSIDGNLYNRDGSILIKYAMGKNEESFTVPDKVKVIESRAFQNSNNLKEITISDGVSRIGSDALPKEVRITAYEGSVAYDYAKSNGMDINVLPARNTGDEEVTTKNQVDTTSKEVETTTGQKTTWKYEQRPTAKVKVPVSKVKKAVKKHKKIKILLKKYENIKKYQIQISTTKRFKKVLLKKTVKKTSFKIKSKKIINRKKLFIRSRAILIVLNNRKYIGEWSKPKKIKM